MAPPRVIQNLRDGFAALTSPAGAAAVVRSHPAPMQFALLMFASAAALYAVYGFSMGLFNSTTAGLISALKLPVLYAGTLLICFPILYLLNHRQGPGLSVARCAAVLGLSMAANAIALASYAPVSYFFILTSSDDAYAFLVAMHVAVFAAAGVVSLTVVAAIMRASAEAARRPLRWRFLIAWALAYGFVGSQMSWALRPWIGAPGVEYAVLRAREGSFLQAVSGVWNEQK